MKFCKLKTLGNLATLCVLLLVVFLLYHDPFLLLWWPQEPAEVGLVLTFICMKMYSLLVIVSGRAEKIFSN